MSHTTRVLLYDTYTYIAVMSRRALMGMRGGRRSERKDNYNNHNNNNKYQYRCIILHCVCLCTNDPRSFCSNNRQIRWNDPVTISHEYTITTTTTTTTTTIYRYYIDWCRGGGVNRNDRSCTAGPDRLQRSSSIFHLVLYYVCTIRPNVLLAYSTLYIL